MKYFFLFVVCVFSVSLSYAQKKGKQVKSRQLDTTTIYHDIFSGTLPRGDGNVLTVLELDHKLYADEGTYNLDETLQKPGGKNPSGKTTGMWTVDRGSADDENATVVVLSDADRMLFFLRRNDSTLQKLDATKQTIEPAERYLLRLRRTAARSAKDSENEFERTMRKLSGTYKGSLPCADCSSITSTLKLLYKPHEKSGEYTLTDKYLGTLRGDAVIDQHGKWVFIEKLIEADHKSTILVLDKEKRGHEHYYLLKKDGNLMPLDRSMNRIESPVDQTMKKQ